MNDKNMEIVIKYKPKEDNEQKVRIFGENFVKNNKDNITLIINGKESKLISKYNLKEGENNIQIIIKNKIINLEEIVSH